MYQTLAAHTVLVAEIKSLTVFSLGFVDDKTKCRIQSVTLLHIKHVMTNECQST